LIATHVLRDEDRRVFVEKQAEECLALRKLLRQPEHHISNTTIDDGDGYHALSAYLPPKEKRGLVLIDPPFEDADEFKRLEQCLIQAAERWPTGVYCLWYPLKSGGLVNPFYAALKRSGLRKLLRAELSVFPADTPLSLNGSGMLILNPPWQLDVALNAAYTELLPLLAPDGQGSARVDWLARE
jgi:23S rRNA (adenine2030-N6)-methyltransferase